MNIMDYDLFQLYEAFQLEIDDSMEWRIEVKANGRADVWLIIPSEIDSKYDDEIAYAKHKSLPMAMSLAWADWQGLNVKRGT